MYLLDSNVLIEAKNRYYDFDIVPGFWQWLGRIHQEGQAGSIARVRQELLRGDDELASWAREHPGFFEPIDEATASIFPQLTQWAQSQSYKPNAVTDFVNSTADYVLVAHAHAHNHTIVTLERSRPGSRRRIKIPDVCDAFDVDCCDTFDLLRRTGASFVLGGARA